MGTWTVRHHGDELGVFMIEPPPFGRTFGEVEKAEERMRLLLEAAPDLLTALEDILQHFSPEHLDNVSRSFCGRNARVALRKAKGLCDLHGEGQA